MRRIARWAIRLVFLLTVSLTVGGCVAKSAGDEQDAQKAQQAAADFLGLPVTDLRLDEVIREPWRHRYRFIFAEYREVHVEMPECKVLYADLTEEWTRAHGEEMVGPIEDEAVARGIAERFVAKHYLPLPEDWSAVKEELAPVSTKLFDYQWRLCYKGVRVSGAWYGVSVSRRSGRVVLCTNSFMPVRVSLTPKLSEEEAKAVVEVKLKEWGLHDRANRRLQHCWLEVGYYPRDARPTAQKQRLVWDIVYEFPYSEEHLSNQEEEIRRQLEAGPPAAWFSIDAQSGELLHSLLREPADQT